MDVWPSSRLLNGPSISNVASLISEALQIRYFPFPPQANGVLKPPGTIPHPHIPPGGKTLPYYLPSCLGKLSWPQQGGMIASSSSFQRDHVQTSSASSWNSRGKPRGKETFTKSLGSFFSTQCVEQRFVRPSSVICIPSFRGEDIWRTWAHLGCSLLSCRYLMLSSVTWAVTVMIAFGEQWLMIVLVLLPNSQ